MLKNSPHLRSVAERLRPRPDIALLDRVLNFTLANGGWEEVHFLRDPDTSYNPRPARVALILAIDAKRRSTAELAAAMLAAIGHGATENCSVRSHSEYCPLFLPEQESLFAECDSLLTIAELQPQLLLARIESTNGANPEADEILAGATIACAARLDLVRHFHQADAETRKSLEESIVSETKDYLQIARHCSIPLANLLNHWLMRYGARNSKNAVNG